jgi:hypothetical protein
LVKIRARVRRRAAAELGRPVLLGQAAQLGIEIERVLLQFIEGVDGARTLVEAA